jgi:glutamine amidotransferase
MDNRNEVVIIDYDMGNIGSVVNMIKKVGGTPIVTSDSKIILSAKRLLLPGVGSFDSGMRNLIAKGLDKTITEAVLVNNIPLLGICLGMQLLLSNSEEGTLNGLDLIKGSAHKFKKSDNLFKIPHMGWNHISIKNASTILIDLNVESRFYFVHSYYVKCELKEDVLSTSNYINEFVSIFGRNNIYGAQFHPEKSHKYGMKLFKNFLSV